MNNDFFKDDSVFPESIEEFHDMGSIQAMDNLIAIKTIMDEFRAKGLTWDYNKIIFYGHSHGAYLGWMCNAFAPGLFSAIIDNSAYLFPYHLDFERNVGVKPDTHPYRYYISDHICDRQIYDLQYLYKRVKNEALILTFHGSEDTMIPYEKKNDFVQQIPNAVMHKIAPENLASCYFELKGIRHPFCYSSASHSLDADFIWLFMWVIYKYSLIKAWGNRGTFQEKIFFTKAYRYNIKLQDGKPEMYRRKH